MSRAGVGEVYRLKPVLPLWHGEDGELSRGTFAHAPAAGPQPQVLGEAHANFQQLAAATNSAERIGRCAVGVGEFPFQVPDADTGGLAGRAGTVRSAKGVGRPVATRRT